MDGLGWGCGRGVPDQPADTLGIPCPYLILVPLLENLRYARTPSPDKRPTKLVPR